MELLKYIPFSSQIDLNFWYKFCEKKLDDLKLSEEPVDFYAEYDQNLTIKEAIATVSHGAFDKPAAIGLLGKLFNKNSIERFKECDKMQVLQSIMDEIIADIKSGLAFEQPELLNRMLMISFADMKKFHFYYWCAFPSVNIADSQFQIGSGPIPLEDKLNPAQIKSLTDAYRDKPFVMVDKNDFSEKPLDSIKSTTDVYIVFSDPSGFDENVGWPLRNFLLLLAYHLPKESEHFDVIALRGSRQTNFKRSRILSIKINKITFDEPGLTYVGFEKNQKGQHGPRFLNLSSSMSPGALAESAVDLNLKLMRWRLVPGLDLKSISGTKCLLLGAGTLGCNVARCLMGWGVRHLTFVDNGRVSYSNPIRQSLFTFDDSLKGGKLKAEAAAEAAKRIFPGIKANHAELSIPMPGHSIAPAMVEQVQKTVEQLEELIEEHDAIFLLLDTREARWLPTLLGAKHGKMVMNAALGFNSFLVMRHGTQKNQLGCYFCNDVVSPTISTKDRALDKQCTVSRPGVSFLASSFVVELLVTLIQHEDGFDAAPDSCSKEGDDFARTSNVLGLAPHQIRCFLDRLDFFTPSVQSFAMCSACSPNIISEYNEKGFDFLLKAFNEDGYLDNVTGLAEMHRIAEDIDILALDDENELSM